MVMVLLCQGMIFETNTESDPAVLAFGVLLMLILVISMLWSIGMMIARKRCLAKDQPITISKPAFDIMMKDTQQEICQLHSAEYSDKMGSLEIPKDKLPPETQDEVCQITTQLTISDQIQKTK
jgi:hypothetical protein